MAARKGIDIDIERSVYMQEITDRRKEALQSTCYRK
jgi:hypothetical protein